MIIRSFVKCGLSNKLDGSEDYMVNIRGIEAIHHNMNNTTNVLATMHRCHHQTNKTINILKDMY